MATLNTKIEQYVGRKVDFLEEVIVEFDHDGNKVIAQWNIESPSQPTDEQLDALEADANAAEDAVKLELLRKERNAKLAETDWMTLADSPTMSDAWKTYRQSLRDITKDYTSLSDVVWPEKP